MSMDHCGEFVQSTAAQITLAIGPPYTTGLTFTVQISKAGGSWGTITPALTEVGNGVYTFALTTTHTNTLGQNVLRFSSTGNDDYFCNFNVVLWNPYTSAISTVATLTTYTGNTPQTGDAFARLGAPVGASISADIAEIEGETDLIVTATNTGVAPGANGGLLIVGTNSGSMNLTGFTTAITGSLSGSVGSVTGAVGSVTGAVGSVTGNVGGNVVGSVASVTAIATSALDLPVDQTLNVILAAVAGKASGLDTNAPKYRNQIDTKDRISATTDANGNRSAVTVIGT